MREFVVTLTVRYRIQTGSHEEAERTVTKAVRLPKDGRSGTLAGWSVRSREIRELEASNGPH